ncbi:cobyric acid synthase [Thiorhodovibrio frisius]|uniref:Cobyric acid synthase n=1 Tax=Thiorhodovibrio frisius TaxID=631362 RepID=H8Z6W7_9GAMM|nr:cobyric acid synthase [Thiorhodovibrio frisius]EIC19752.1 cobyric acid synthase CobQ [Thiorhodovibrio frisius]WPL20280.1 Cobyric acid synthase [Thiorhodovibrio frisius]
MQDPSTDSSDQSSPTKPPSIKLDLPPLATHGPRRARALMIQGTASDVGKSMMVAGLCRAYARRGLVVRPFKAQNMSNNAAVTQDSDAAPGPDGERPRGEIGRAQALQARACGVAPSIHMNPVLLKPQTNIGSQVVLRGRVLGNCPARVYHEMRQGLMPAVLDSFERLCAEADLVLVEGAGSGAEIYLRHCDITNMHFAERAGVPVVVVGDLDKGGTMASLVGTWLLLDQADRDRVVGYLVNKFRGDFSLFEPACETITAHTGWPFLGVLRWFEGASRLPAEDSLALERPASLNWSGAGTLKIAVPRLSRVANFDDLDPLAAEPGVDLRWLQSGQPLPADTDVVILPGSKATRADLDTLRREGWDIDILAHVRRGGRVLGLCAGFQMLGTLVRDPEGLEGEPGDTPGLGLLDMVTEIGPEKRLLDIDATELTSGCAISGYEMHMGRTTGPALKRPWLRLGNSEVSGSGVGRPEGAISADGRVMGGYLHGIFSSDAFRAHWLAQVGAQASALDFIARTEAALDELADHCEANLDLDALLALAR